MMKTVLLLVVTCALGCRSSEERQPQTRPSLPSAAPGKGEGKGKGERVVLARRTHGTVADSYRMADQACRSGDRSACSFVQATMHLAGQGVAQSESKALELFASACGGGWPAGCGALGRMCDLGQKPACDRLAGEEQ